MGPMRRAHRTGLPAHWRKVLAGGSGQWGLLDDGERERLGEIAERLLVHKRWEAARGFELTDERRVLIAGHGALLALGLDGDPFTEVGTIVVRAGAMRRRAPIPNWGRVEGLVDGSPAPVDGQAHHRDGPLMISWSAFRREAANVRLGRDVVLHELAHKLDMLDGIVDGTPPTDDRQRDRWIEVCTAEYELIKAGEAGRLLRPYAGTNPGEFFAVATETFFTRPVRLRDEKPELYGVLAAYFGQDPAARVERAA